MDKIVMSRMAFYGYHGVFPEETRLGQRFIVDVELSLSLSKAGRHDSLDETVNYADAYALIKECAEQKTFKLIEALADSIASALLERYPIVHEVFVRVTKPNPPFDIHFDGVSVEMRRRRPVDAYIGAGSNLGDRAGFLEEAIRLLNDHPEIRVERRSSIYETEPVGYTDQPAFLNMVVKVKTELAPEELLTEMLRVEEALGRQRDVRWGPRTIDLDLLLYGHTVRVHPLLSIPHPRMAERAFVLIPLKEVAGEHDVPGVRSLSELLNQVPGKEGVRRWI